ncbi:hypothetical protein TKK_0017085 [Trichogramma kaykai]
MLKNNAVKCINNYLNNLSLVSSEAAIIVKEILEQSKTADQNNYTNLKTKVFAQNLYEMKIDDPFITSDTQFDIRTSKSFIKVNSQSGISKSKKINKLTSLKELDYKADENFGPLSNVR